MELESQMGFGLIIIGAGTKLGSSGKASSFCNCRTFSVVSMFYNVKLDYVTEFQHFTYASIAVTAIPTGGEKVSRVYHQSAPQSLQRDAPRTHLAVMSNHLMKSES